jgi:hypothetical protein
MDNRTSIVYNYIGGRYQAAGEPVLFDLGTAIYICCAGNSGTVDNIKTKPDYEDFLSKKGKGFSGYEGIFMFKFEGLPFFTEGLDF